MKRTIDGLQTEINRLDAQIETDFSAVSVIEYPPQYLNSIIHTLVSNSLKYHYPGRRPLIRIRTEKDGDNVILKVSDNGLGSILSNTRRISLRSARFSIVIPMRRVLGFI